MGIPGLFGWLLKKYKKGTLISERYNGNVNELYVDANCMFHPSCFKAYEIFESKKDPKIHDYSLFTLENYMIDTCITDLDELIQYVNPNKLLFVAVDGVAPLAKINQQRKRRYKAFLDTQIKNDIKKKYGKKINDDWTNASITPGTEFMEKLHVKLMEHLKILKTKLSCNIIYSSYHTVGEGEHKIFEYIRANKTQNKNKIVYGLDADLIFLSIASKCNNITLIRENSEFDEHLQNEKFIFVSIDNIINCFNNYLISQLQNKSYELGIVEDYDKDYIDDIVFICNLLGNDFLPHIPTIDIKKSGLDMLIDAYVNTKIKHKKQLLEIKDHSIQINMIFFDDFLCYLATLEKNWMENYNDYQKIIEPRFNDEYEKDIWLLDNMRYSNFRSQDVFIKNIGTFEDWKFKYYEKHIGCIESQDITIDNMCYKFLEGMVWVIQYYYVGCPSWNWTFNYSHSPFIIDLSDYLKDHYMDLNKVTFQKGEPLVPVTQLLCVIPPSYNKLLPVQIRELMKNEEIIDMFPQKFNLDTFNKELFWQCIPILPELRIEQIKKIMSSTKQDEYTKRINKLCENTNI